MQTEEFGIRFRVNSAFFLQAPPDPANDYQQQIYESRLKGAYSVLTNRETLKNGNDKFREDAKETLSYLEDEWGLVPADNHANERPFGG
ncbi:hypothetical protein BGX23_006673 [Mortierella sp. AD031]|nr:hypothetical protein BGX23_006673 [Mortierella sp. AD031]KAG0217185.1 hypothetical protein BGX33_011179 [Mortierella sp. NVP41]